MTGFRCRHAHRDGAGGAFCRHGPQPLRLLPRDVPVGRVGAPSRVCPERRTSSRSASNRAATSISPGAATPAETPFSVVSSGTRAFYPRAPAVLRSRGAGRSQHAHARPWASGGSETYARGLAGALARRGERRRDGIRAADCSRCGRGASHGGRERVPIGGRRLAAAAGARTRHPPAGPAATPVRRPRRRPLSAHRARPTCGSPR